MPCVPTLTEPPKRATRSECNSQCERAHVHESVSVGVRARLCVHVCSSLCASVCARTHMRACVRACINLCVRQSICALSCVRGRAMRQGAGGRQPQDLAGIVGLRVRCGHVARTLLRQEAAHTRIGTRTRMQTRAHKRHTHACARSNTCIHTHACTHAHTWRRGGNADRLSRARRRRRR